jgi:3-hydroxybutyryl-CoA dehydrogenase
MKTVNEIKNITVLGAGIMGHGIAQGFLMGGYPVKLFDIQETILDGARAHIQKGLERFCDARLIEKEKIATALDLLSTTTDLEEAVRGSDYIAEAIPEVLALKQDTFQRVESLISEDTIMASNASHLTLADIFSKVTNKTRVVGTHYFNPPHIVPVVEVVKCDGTEEAAIQATCDLLEKIKKVPVKINKAIPGLLVNRVLIALAREVVDLYEQGVASAEDIDKAIKGSLGFRYACVGPLLTMDLGGIEGWMDACRTLLPHMQQSTEAPGALLDLLDKGRDGIHSGRGFFDYSADSSDHELDHTIQKRDRDMLDLLKKHYQ